MSQKRCPPRDLFCLNSPFFSLTGSADKQLLFSYLYYDQRGPWRKDGEGNSFCTDVIWIKCRQREALLIFIGTPWPKPSNSETFGLDNSHNGLSHPSSSHGWAGWTQRMQSATVFTWYTQPLAQVKRQGSGSHHLTFGTWVLKKVIIMVVKLPTKQQLETIFDEIECNQSGITTDRKYIWDDGSFFTPFWIKRKRF